MFYQDCSVKAEEFDDHDLQSVMDVIDDAQRVHGMTSATFSLDVPLLSGVIDVEETADNEALLTSLDDSVQLIQQRYLPATQRWTQVSVLSSTFRRILSSTVHRILSKM